MHWKLGDSLDNEMAISRTGSQDCWSWTLTSKYDFLSSFRFLPCRSICVMVWEEKIKSENEGNETSPYEILPSLFTWGGVREMSTWEVRDICWERREGNTAASRSFDVSQLSAEQWLLLHKHLSAGREHSIAWKSEAPWLFFGLQLDVFCFKNFFSFWRYLRASLLLFCSFAHKLWPSPGSQHHLIRAVTVTRQHCCTPGTDTPSCCFLSSGSALRNSSQRSAQGSSASLFSMRLCPRSHFWLKLLSFILSRIWEFSKIQTIAFMSLDSIFCFPKMQNSPENDCFISSVTQIRRDILFFNTFPLSSFLPLSSCLLLLTQAYFLIKRGRFYWKAA